MTTAEDAVDAEFVRKQEDWASPAVLVRLRLCRQFQQRDRLLDVLRRNQLLERRSDTAVAAIDEKQTKDASTTAAGEKKGRLGGKTAPWPKACASLSESLAKLGARTEVGTKAVPGATQIQLSADGRVSTRKDPEDNTPGYRFEGTISSHVRGLDSPIDDSYQALTGWNPVSDAMATDILAISAAKRLVERMAQSWQ